MAFTYNKSSNDDFITYLTHIFVHGLVLRFGITYFDPIWFICLFLWCLLCDWKFAPKG